MLILALDTSSASGSLAVLRDENVIGSVSTWTDETYSSRMFRQLDFLLHELSVGIEDFDLFAVVTGPGSFTGLRVGLTAAKGWAEVYGKPVAGVSGLEAVAAQAQPGAQIVVPVLDARRGEVYFGVYRRAAPPAGGECVLEGKERVATPQEFAATLEARGDDSGCMVVSPSPGLLLSTVASELAAARASVEQVSAILATSVGRIGYLRAQRGQLANALTLDANYVRRSDAELNWKAARGI